MRDAIIDDIRKCICDLAENNKELFGDLNSEDIDELKNLKETDSLDELGIINSITFIRLVLALEAKFQIQFDDDKLHYDNFSNIINIAEYLESKLR